MYILCKKAVYDFIINILVITGLTLQVCFKKLTALKPPTQTKQQITIMVQFVGTDR